MSTMRDGLQTKTHRIYDLSTPPTKGVRYGFNKKQSLAEKAVDALLLVLTLEEAIKLNHEFCEIFAKNHSLWLVFIRVKEELRLRQKRVEEESNDTKPTTESNEPI